MVNANGIRRSTRLAAKSHTTAKPEANARTPIQKKPMESRQRIQKKNSSTSFETTDVQPDERALKPRRPRIRTSIAVPTIGKRPTPAFLGRYTSTCSSGNVENNPKESSEEELDTETESEGSDDEPIRRAGGSRNQFERRSSRAVGNAPGRRISVQTDDSRLESGNEDYEMDDFVVDDDESVYTEDGEVSDAFDGDLDLAINMVRHPARATFQSISHSGSSSTSPRSIRQASSTSDRRRRSSSQLFMSDLEGKPFLPPRLPSWEDLGFVAGDEAPEAPLIAQASAEVVEEIIDALALFSRRVNRDRPPINLRLASAVLQDEEIRDALESAIRNGLGRKLSLADGSKHWTIGPRR